MDGIKCLGKVDKKALNILVDFQQLSDAVCKADESSICAPGRSVSKLTYYALHVNSQHKLLSASSKLSKGNVVVR